MTFPEVAEAFWGWTEPVVFRKITKTVQDFEILETQGADTTFDGVIQPVPAQRLLIKPEGQRDWKWWTLWTEELLGLDDVVIDPDGKRYRVMRVSDWSEALYHEYELTEAP